MEPTTATLEANLGVLSIGSPRLAELIRRTEARGDITFFTADDGALSATIADGATSRQLASRRRPLEEARRWAEAVQIESAGALVVLGFGLGHHVAALAARVRRTGVLMIYEPDLGLLRAALERVPCAAWLAATNVVFLTDPDDRAAISEATRGVEGLMALGVRFVEHPASIPRLGPSTERFKANVAACVGTVKTALVTTLVQTEVTVRNLLMNLDRYAAGPGIADLAGAATGRPAIVVSAGPSLRRNIDLLSRPDVRERFVIIAAQTVLKTLLERGIHPHFVTALDYHEISRRFYEGLSAEDVRGVTLVAEAKANPAILDAFPGTIRCVGDEILDDLLGPGLARPMGSVPPGATVAHLAYSLARHLGCDPVVLVGQDLGFTDGQYYSAGAAIHQVWSGELNAFNTLEMMEWQRIVRGRRSLRRATDAQGRPIYTDEQMATYLAQFEREFLGDSARGLRIIDATEGGVAKSHTTPMTLAETLGSFGADTPIHLPEPALDAGGATGRVADRVREVRRGVWHVARQCRVAASKLTEMLEHHRDQSRVNRLIREVERLRDDVTATQPAFRLVDRLNQVGVLNRFREDRGIELSADLSPLERQRRQIERDIKNVTWLGDAADQLGSMLDDAVKCLGGAPKITRDPPAGDDKPGSPAEPADRAPHAAHAAHARRTVHAVIPVDTRAGPLGTPRRLDEPLHAGLNPLQLTLARLAHSERIGGVVLLCEDPGAVREIVGRPPAALNLRYETIPAGSLATRAPSLRGSRGWAAGCWRGGLGLSTVFDEVADPALLGPLMDRLGIDAAVCLGPDWCLVDPSLIDQVVERHLERPDRQRLAFAQVAPGLGACIVARSLAEELAVRPDAGVFSTVGAVLGYVPVQPLPDPIAKPWCVATPLPRDLGLRLIADSAPGRHLVAATLGMLGQTWVSATAEEVAAAARQADDAARAHPSELILELCTGRRTSGPRGEWLRGAVEPVERPPIAESLARRLIGEHAEAGGSLLTLFGAGDPLLHPDFACIIRAAGDAGLAVHVRTDLLCDDAAMDSLLEAGPHVISVDLMAETPGTYRSIMGADLFPLARANLERLLRAQGRAGPLPTPWVVPRLTRCDAAYTEIEPFFDRWTLAAGAAVIDALPAALVGQRIEPLPRPEAAARRMWHSRMLVLCDGAAPASERDVCGEGAVASAASDGLPAAWKRVLAARLAAARDHGPSHPDLWTGW